MNSHKNGKAPGGAAFHPADLVFEPMPVATADEVRSLRLAMGMTQEELAGEMGVKEFSVWRWENNKRPMTVAMTKLLRSIAERKRPPLVR